MRRRGAGSTEVHSAWAGVARVATAVDLDAVVDTLVESHVDYVWEAWALPFADRRDRMIELFSTDLRVIGHPHGQIWTTANSTSVAVWLPAGADDRLGDSDRDVLAEVKRVAFGDREVIVDEVATVIAASSPAPVDWRLATMGTRLAHRRRGLGAAVLEPMLEQLDRRAETARLETSDVNNVRFYARFGFYVTAELDDLPHHAPTTWIMDRPPQPFAPEASDGR